MNSPRINRVLQVLSLVAFASMPTQLKDIGSKLGLSPSMVSRIVADLIAGGLLAKVSYRTVIGTPELAALGKSAGENHPLTRIARETLLRPMVERERVSCEFATLVQGRLYHFCKVLRKEARSPLLFTDTAAVICAARGDEWEKVLEELSLAFPEDAPSGFPLFKERFLAARENRTLVNHHGGRLWQLTYPVVCGDLCCALSFSGVDSNDMDSSFFARLAARIRANYEGFTQSNA